MYSKRPYEEGGFESGVSHTKRAKTFDVSYRGAAEHRDYTIAWVCALPLELTASLAMLDEEHPVSPNPVGDDNTYVLGRIGQHDVVMVCLPGQYGTNNAAVVTTNLKRSFPSIRGTLMVGIGGGCPTQADLYLGDVVVGTRVMQYDMGKVVAGGDFLETADPKSPAPLLNSAVSALRSKRASHRSSQQMTNLLRSRLPKLSRPNSPDRLFQASYEHPSAASNCDGCDENMLQVRRVRLSDEPKIHYGVIASGNRVMKNAKTRDDIARRHSALCFEMEAAGMMDNLQCLPIRGICDYSDSHKNKEWQVYAAATAAAYARELLEVLPPPLSLAANMKALSYSTSWSDMANKSDIAGTRSVENTLERRQYLLDSLHFPQIDARKTTIRTAHARTCGWLIEHSVYQDWLDSSKQWQSHGFLWMRGKAGAGKSTMMKFLYLSSKQSDKPGQAITASFFFNARGNYLEQSITGMYRSLLMQLLQSYPDLQWILDDTDIVPRGQQDCPDLNALKELFAKALMALGPRCFTCFIDALDECDEQEVRDMVHFFEDLAEQTTNEGIHLRICFSSRPYPYISIRKGILFTLEDEPGHAQDLAQYVENRLTIDDPLLLAELQTEILEKASGIFLWIVLVVDILNKEDDNGGLALRTKLSEIPARLGDLFKSILMRDQKSPQRLLLCVLLVLCAREPLQPAEFRHAMWAGLLDQSSKQKGDQVDSVLPEVQNSNAYVKLVTSSSKGLAEITKSHRPTVQFVHESVRDFLVKERGLQELWPELGYEWEGPSHERLRRCCAAYLDFARVQTLVANQDRPPKEAERRALAQKYPFLEYASQQVLYHADTAANAIPQDDFLRQFFASNGIKVLNLFQRLQKYENYTTPLYALAQRGLGSLIRIQMKQASAASSLGDPSSYPFFAALGSGNKDAVAAILGLSSTICDGVDILEGFNKRDDLKEYEGRTPLSWAAQEGKMGFVKILLHDGINENDYSGGTPLIRASANGHEDIARLLIAKGASLEKQGTHGCTPLLRASELGREAMVQLLIASGANVNVRDSAGSTPLILASERGREAIVRLLLAGGAHVNIQNRQGKTALAQASKKGHARLAELLIANGADVGQ